MRIDLDLGHVAGIETVVRSGNAALSKDGSGHWVLWALAARRAVASGDLPACGPGGPTACPAFQLTLAGGTLAVLDATGIELRTASTGALLATVPAAANAGLARDGSYAWTATTSRLQAYSLSGALRVDVAGDYSRAAVSAEPGVLRVANGPVGSGALEIIQLGDGRSTTVPFSGQFSSWFDDGQHFLTVTGSAVSVYTSAGERQAIGALPSLVHLTGQGGFVWTYSDFTPGYPLRIYAATDLSAPVHEFALDTSTRAIAAGPEIGIVPYGSAYVELIQLGVTVTRGPHLPVPAPYLSAFGGDTAGHWLVGGQGGGLFDGDAVGATPATATSLTLGAPWTLAGSPGATAVLGVASRRTAVLTLGDTDTAIRILDTPAYQAAISGDEATLVATDDLGSSQYHEDRSLRVVALADGTVTHAWPYVWSDYPTLFMGFSLARDAGIIFHQIERFDGANWRAQYAFSNLRGDVLPVYGPAPDGQLAPVARLSPGGTRAAFTLGGHGEPVNSELVLGATTQLYLQGVLAGAVDGVFETWLDNDRVLVASYKVGDPKFGSPVFDRMTLYDGTGTSLGAPRLPDPGGPVISIDGQLVYLQSRNAVYDLASGAVVWQGNPAGKQGVVVGNSIVYLLGRDLYRAAFRPAR